MKIKLGIAFFPWFTSMQTKKLFSYFHVNVFFIGGDKCNQSSSRQGRRACRRGGGLLVLSSLGIIKQGNWKWYLIDTAISTARQCLIPSLHTPLVYVRPSRLPQVKPVEEKKTKKILTGANFLSNPPPETWEPAVNLRTQCCEGDKEEKVLCCDKRFQTVTSSDGCSILHWRGTWSTMCILINATLVLFSFVCTQQVILLVVWIVIHC